MYLLRHKLARIGWCLLVWLLPPVAAGVVGKLTSRDPGEGVNMWGFSQSQYGAVLVALAVAIATSIAINRWRRLGLMWFLTSISLVIAGFVVLAQVDVSPAASLALVLVAPIASAAFTHGRPKPVD